MLKKRIGFLMRSYLAIPFFLLGAAIVGLGSVFLVLSDMIAPKDGEGSIDLFFRGH